MLERMRCGQMTIGGWCKVSVNFDCKHHGFRPFIHHCCSSLCLLGCLPITSHRTPHASPFCCRPLALVLTAYCLVPVPHWHGFVLTCKASAPVPTWLDYYTLFLLLLVFVLDLYITALVLAQSRSLLCLVFLRLCVLTKELLPRHAFSFSLSTTWLCDCELPHPSASSFELAFLSAPSGLEHFLRTRRHSECITVV